jgi:hypothetical protein
MLIRQAFHTFLQVQSEADHAEAALRPVGPAPAWPMDYVVRGEAFECVVDWRWFEE